MLLAAAFPDPIHHTLYDIRGTTLQLGNRVFGDLGTQVRCPLYLAWGRRWAEGLGQQVGEDVCAAQSPNKGTRSWQLTWHAAMLHQGLRGWQTPALSWGFDRCVPACSTPRLAQFAAHAYDTPVCFTTWTPALVPICPQVAACICLFSLDKQEAIPVDTHVWQLAKQHYMPHLKGQLGLRVTALGCINRIWHPKNIVCGFECI